MAVDFINLQSASSKGRKKIVQHNIHKVFYPPVIKGGNGKSPFKLRFEFGK